MEKYTQAELDAAFKTVQDKVHWKNPIRAFIPASQRDVVYHAIIHFTATVPTFQDAGGMLFVSAAGYRAGPAGDH